MRYPEDFATVTIPFTTNDATGAPVAPSSAFTTSDFKIYKNGSATEKTSTNGLTVTSPFDSATGSHVLVIDTSVDTGDTGFWVAGAVYDVKLETAKTVDGKSVSRWLGKFFIDTQQADITAIKGYIDTEIAAIKAKTDNLPASPAATGDIPSAATVADAVWDEARSGHVTAGSFGEGVLVQTVNANALNTNSFSAGCISSTAISASAAQEIADEVYARGDIDGYTGEQFAKLVLAALVGKLSGAATTTNTVRAADDSKDRITATVDADGNRTAVTLDAAG